MELLFTTLMTQLIGATHPKVDKNRVYEENLRAFREAGWGWDEVGKALGEAGIDAEMSHAARRDKAIRAYRRSSRAIEQLRPLQDLPHKLRGMVRSRSSRPSPTFGRTRRRWSRLVEIALRDRKRSTRLTREMFPNDGRGAAVRRRTPGMPDSASMAAAEAARRRRSSSHPVRSGGKKALGK
jgi:hypothetical protein